jgi:hypothetical protein
VTRGTTSRFLETLLKLTTNRHIDLVKPAAAHPLYRTVKPSSRASIKASLIRLPYSGTTTTYGRGKGGVTA